MDVHAAVEEDLAGLRREVTRLQAENSRLLRLLELTPQEARPPAPAQTAIFDTQPGAVHAGSPPAAKVAFYAALFGARTDVYAQRWENTRTAAQAGCPPCEAGGAKACRHPSGSTFP